MTRSLADALDYRNDAVVHKFRERIDMPFEDAAAIFEETKKWLWLCMRANEERRRFAIGRELIILDEMWHTFVLFTREYADYCRDRLGRFIHHVPTTKAEKDARAERFAADPAGERARADSRLREDLEFIAAELGADTVFKWFVEFPRRYGPEFFERSARGASSTLGSGLLDRLGEIADRYQSAARGQAE